MNILNILEKYESPESEASFYKGIPIKYLKDVQKSYKSSCSMPRRKINDIIINPDQRKKMILNKGDRIITLSK